MPWRQVQLRGQKVLARCDQSGALVVDGGRVEIRYRASDAKAYGAAPKNLSATADATIYPDSHCVPGQAAPRREGGAKGARAGSGGAPPSAPKPGEALAYCDGACTGNPGPCGAGAVLLYDDERHELSEYLGDGINNIGELTAIWRAVEAAPPGRPLHVYTDSTYGIGVLSKGWKAKANVALIGKARAAIAAHGAVSLHYVKGHAGIPLNERADGLAVAAVRRRSGAGWTRVA